MRNTTLRTSMLTLLFLALPLAQAAEPTTSTMPPIRVTLLGTGTPSLSPERFGNSTLVQAGGLNLVFDAGRGSTIRLAQLKVPLGKIDATFITHFHSDHLNGLADLWTTSFLRTPQNGRTTPFELYGPTGIKPIAMAMEAMFAPDVAIREEDAEVAPAATQIQVHAFDAPATVFQRNGVTISAFNVDHGKAIKPAVGYRIDYDGHSVVISGDTRYDQRVIDQAKGVDLLVHEVGAISTHHLQESWAKPVAGHHTSPEEAGKVFALAKPKMAVFSHISRPGPKDETNTDQAIHDRAAAQWKGPIVVGEDLMSFDIGSTVTMHRHDPSH